MSSFYDVSVNINPKWFFVKFHFLDFWYTSFKTLQTRGKVSSHTIYNFCILPILNSYVTWAWQCNVSLLPSLFTACSLQSVSISWRQLVGILASFFGSQLQLIVLFIYVCFVICISYVLFYRWRWRLWLQSLYSIIDCIWTNLRHSYLAWRLQCFL